MNQHFAVRIMVGLNLVITDVIPVAVSEQQQGNIPTVMLRDLQQRFDCILRSINECCNTRRFIRDQIRMGCGQAAGVLVNLHTRNLPLNITFGQRRSSGVSPSNRTRRIEAHELIFMRSGQFKL